MDGTRGALVEAIVGMREKEAAEAARAMLDAGGDPLGLLDACRKAVETVGQRFESGEYFLPELMLAGEIVNQISGMVKARLADGAPAQERRLGRVVMGTVKGDIHDIGKNIVSFLLDANGFEVIDLGVDVPPERFVEAVRQFEPQVVGMSCLLTLAYDPMKETVRALEDGGLRDRVKVMIGGAATNDQIRVYTGADAWGKDAAEAVSLARAWVGR